MTTLDHEQFEGATVLAEIGAKIAAGRAALSDLETSKEDFLNVREADAVARVKQVLEQSQELIGEIGQYHSELVGYRNEVDGFLRDILYLVQRVGEWKREFDSDVSFQNREIDKKILQNTDILIEIKGQRALLAGETSGIKAKREALRLDTLKIKDEWATLGRAKEELTTKK